MLCYYLVFVETYTLIYITVVIDFQAIFCNFFYFPNAYVLAILMQSPTFLLLNKLKCFYNKVEGETVMFYL